MSARFLRFLIAGGVAATVNIGSRHLFNHVVSFESAVVAAFLSGMVTAYLLLRLLVFEASGSSKAFEFLRFAIANLFALVLTWIISVGLARLVFPAVGLSYHPDDAAHLIGVMAPAVTSYFVHCHFTFATKQHESVNLTTSH